MPLINFPETVDVTLSSKWTGYIGLTAGLTLPLGRYSYNPNDTSGGTQITGRAYYSENGADSVFDTSTNRLVFKADHLQYTWTQYWRHTAYVRVAGSYTFCKFNAYALGAGYQDYTFGTLLASNPSRAGLEGFSWYLGPLTAQPNNYQDVFSAVEEGGGGGDGNSPSSRVGFFVL